MPCRGTDPETGLAVAFPSVDPCNADGHTERSQLARSIQWTKREFNCYPSEFINVVKAKSCSINARSKNKEANNFL